MIMKNISILLPIKEKIGKISSQAVSWSKNGVDAVCRHWRTRKITYLAPSGSFRYNKIILFVLMILAWFILNMTLQYWQYMQNLLSSNLILGVPIALLSLCILLFLAWFWLNDVRGIVSLHRRQEIQKQIFDLINADDANGLKKCLLSTVKKDDPCRSRLESCWKEAATINDIIEIYQKTVLAGRDCQADLIILKYAALSGGANVVSSKAVLDFVITQILYSKMVIEIAKTYGIRLGVCSFFKLMALGIAGAFFSGVVTGIIEKFIHQMFAKITGEAVSSVLIMVQLGFRIKFALRPVVPEKNGYLVNNIRQILQDIKKNTAKQTEKYHAL